MQNQSSARFASIKQLAANPQYPFSESSLRHLVFDAQPRLNSKGEKTGGNGLATAVFRIGRKVLIDLDRFDEWLEGHRCGEEA